MGPRAYQCLICLNDRVGRSYEKGDLHLAECARCGFVQQDPLPDTEALDAEYGDEAHYMDEILRTEGAFLGRDRQVVDRLAAAGAGGPLLDVGAGAGTLLRAAQDRGWEAVGLEISKPSAEHLKRSLGVEVFDVPLESAPIEPGRFGVVTFSHSLEHVTDPVEALRHAARALRPGGRVHIAVPNWNALKRRLTGLEVSWIYVHHLSYFNRGSLGRALEAAGFMPERWSGHALIGADYPFVIALFRTLHLEPAIRDFLRMGDRPLETLIADDVRIDCPPWRFRAVFRLARMILRLWPENLLAFLGCAEELRVTAVRRDRGNEPQ